MSTNYYWHPSEASISYWTGLHIGKSSCGWTFALHVHDPSMDEYREDDSPTQIPRDLDGWRERWKDGVIVDEYGSRISPEQMMDIITNRGQDAEFTEEYRDDFVRRMQSMGHNRTWDKFLRDNYAIEGPRRLLRRAIDERHCIGYGDTWDLCIGEFC